MPFGLGDQPYANIHYLSSSSEPNEHDLKAIIRSYPLIDNHAHNLLREEEAHGNEHYPFESITSEAQGHALQEHVQSTLAHVRAVKQLAELLKCPASLEDVKAARYEWVVRDYDSFIRTCFAGTHALLLDDGLPQDSVYPVRWHDRHAPTVRRIARIEAVAAELLEQLAHAAGFLAPGVDSDWAIEKSEAFLLRFNTMFRNQIKTLAADPGVCGFKSVVCYRSGLDVSLSSRHTFRPHQSLADSALLSAFHSFLQDAVRKHDYRVAEKVVNDFLVVAACDVLHKLVETEGETLPIQFHTGLGDVDIDLIKSNPAYMQPLIEAFPNVDFVILHSSYPYTREAGYLAANYANAWLDIGEIFPMISRQGQESVLRQALELTPASKILWSTDGHFYPETFYLANRQFRDALESVLGELVASEDLTLMQAINIAVDILFWNSNALYKLDEERRFPQLLRACGRADSASRRSTLVNSRENGSATRDRASISHVSISDAGLYSSASTAVHSPTRTRGTPVRSAPRSDATRPASDPFTDTGDSTTMSPRSHRALSLHRAPQLSQDATEFEAFMRQHPEVKYIWLQFISHTATMRARMIPVKQFQKHIARSTYPGISRALTRQLQNERPADGCIATGEFQLVPDFRSLCLNRGIDSPSATVQTWWMVDSDDNDQKVCWDRCPRYALQKQMQALSDEFELFVLMGFEIEVIFVRPMKNDNGTDFTGFDVVHELHSWSNMTYQQLDMLSMIEEIVDILAEIGIDVCQFHAESAPTQWEFSLPPSSPLKAVDQLYKAKETIGNITKKHGLKATFYPRPYAMAPGSAQHAHFSINGDSETVGKHADSFLAGVLQHLPSILAFSLPVEESYARVASGVWAGGEWITWGTQNREVPLRKCGPGHWEFKPIDGMGNTYLSMAALIAAGLLGLRDEISLVQQDTLVDVSTLDQEEREGLGITERLPNTLQKSLDSLREDGALVNLLGQNLVDDYLAVKKAEMEMLNEMDEQKRRTWLMARY